MYCPNGEIEMKFTGGLGITSNNQFEALAFWKGLKMASSRGFRHISLIRDSMIVIKICLKIKDQNEEDLPPIFLRIGILLKKFEVFDIYHVRRENNQIVDEQANRGTNLEQGMVILDHGSQSHAIFHEKKNN